MQDKMKQYICHIMYTHTIYVYTAMNIDVHIPYNGKLWRALNLAN